MGEGAYCAQNKYWKNGKIKRGEKKTKQKFIFLLYSGKNQQFSLFLLIYLFVFLCFLFFLPLCLVVPYLCYLVIWWCCCSPTTMHNLPPFSSLMSKNLRKCIFQLFESYTHPRPILPFRTKQYKKKRPDLNKKKKKNPNIFRMCTNRAVFTLGFSPYPSFVLFCSLICKCCNSFDKGCRGVSVLSTMVPFFYISPSIKSWITMCVLQKRDKCRKGVFPPPRHMEKGNVVRCTVKGASLNPCSHLSKQKKKGGRRRGKQRFAQQEDNTHIHTYTCSHVHMFTCSHVHMFTIRSLVRSLLCFFLFLFQFYKVKKKNSLGTFSAPYYTFYSVEIGVAERGCYFLLFSAILGIWIFWCG